MALIAMCRVHDMVRRSCVLVGLSLTDSLTPEAATLMILANDDQVHNNCTVDPQDASTSLMRYGIRSGSVVYAHIG